MQASKKLGYRKINLFKIKTKRSNVNYELKLLKKIKIYPIFHIFLLKLVNRSTLVQNRLLKLLTKNKYKIKRIQNFNDMRYLIKQKEYRNKESLQKSSEFLNNYQKKLKEYQKRSKN